MAGIKYVLRCTPAVQEMILYIILFVRKMQSLEKINQQPQEKPVSTEF